jgi:hypothetical protein
LNQRTFGKNVHVKRLLCEIPDYSTDESELIFNKGGFDGVPKRKCH